MTPRYLAILVMSLCLTGCWGFAHDELIAGPYRLIAVDLDEQMSVSYALHNGNAVGRINEMVFSAGANKEYIVAQRHPKGDRTITEYYYIIRALDSEYADPSKSVRGPFTKQEFESEKTELKLPEFTIEITSLK